MRTIEVETINGLQKETVFKIDELSYLGKLIGCKESKRKDVTYLEIPAAFDIETTTICEYDEHGKIDSSMVRPYAFMYHWQFCLDDEVCFGRTWEEFKTLLDTISDRMHLSMQRRLVIWVHNLAFEFQFFRRFVNVMESFIIEEHKPIKIVLGNGIEFRDSYILSNMSLAKFCQNERGVIHYKLSGGDYDYKKRRTAVTPMTRKEEAYCYNDVRGLCECIRSRMQDDTLGSMPMTATGYVRRMYRAAMKVNADNWYILHNGKLTPHLYELLRRAFRGGDCHANIRYANQTLTSIQSWDISSSYPAVLMTEKFPMGKWEKVSKKYFKKHMGDIFDRYAVLMTVRYEQIRYIAPSNNPYISESKCDHIPNNRSNADRIIIDNGRIGYADWLEMTITDIDFGIIEDEYTYQRRMIKEIWICKKDYLPEEFRDTLRSLYIAKTSLKGDPDHEYEYNKSKNAINSSYGMCVQRLDKDNWTYVDGEYDVTAADMEKIIDRYYKNRNSFLRYEWGVWCTAYARQRLRLGLALAGSRYVYCDTDSIKADKDMTECMTALNEELKAKAVNAKAYADDKYGKRHYMGVYEYECTYDKFRTIGSKKYAYQMGDEVYTTIAGVSKRRGQEFFTEKGIDHMRDGVTIPDSGHLVAYYNEDDIHTIEVDGCEMTTGSNIALCDDTYTLGMTGDYKDLIIKALENITDIYYT